MVRKLATRTLVGLAAVCLAVGLTATPAQAYADDLVKFTEQELDFGRNWVAGAPLNSGELAWDFIGFLVSPTLSNGNIYINNASGTCARMRLETYDANHVFLGYANDGRVCAPDGSLNSWSVNVSAPANFFTTHAHVILQVQTAGGGYLDVATQYENMLT
jgi:hypothetical protein